MYPALDFSSCLCENDKINLAYEIFKRDFVDTPCFLEPILVSFKTDKKIKQGNLKLQEAFWHIISRKNGKNRIFDEQRAKRIAWIKLIILDYNKKHIKLFYCYESNRTIRLYLWLYEYNFVVILEKAQMQEKIAFIITSFYIDNEKKQKSFEQKYKNYKEKSDAKLKDCEWF